MSRQCLNPDCERVMPVIGVCIRCANSSYDPHEDDIDIDEYDPAWETRLQL